MYCWWGALLPVHKMCLGTWWKSRKLCKMQSLWCSDWNILRRNENNTTISNVLALGTCHRQLWHCETNMFRLFMWKSFIHSPSRLITQKEHHYYVKTVSFWRNYVKMTSFWRYNDVIITSYVRRVCITPVLTRAARTAVSWEYPRLSHDDPYCRFILDPFNSKSIGPPTTLSRLPRGHTENEMFAVNTVEVTERTRICLQIDRQTDKVLHIHMIPPAY